VEFPRKQFRVRRGVLSVWRWRKRICFRLSHIALSGAAIGRIARTTKAIRRTHRVQREKREMRNFLFAFSPREVSSQLLQRLACGQTGRATGSTLTAGS
jgi:hypothetical protein